MFDANGGGYLPLPGNANVDGLVMIDANHFYLSFSGTTTTITGFGTVEDEDVVEYNNGVWSGYFDGTAQGLTANAQDLDAINMVGNTLYFSTVGSGTNATVPGVASPYDDADIYAWDGASFSRVFDASAAGLAGNADVDGLAWIDADHFYMSFNAATRTRGQRSWGSRGREYRPDTAAVFGRYTSTVPLLGLNTSDAQDSGCRTFAPNQSVNGWRSISMADLQHDLKGETMKKHISRRDFLKLAGGAAVTVAGAGLLPQTLRKDTVAGKCSASRTR